MNILCDIMWLNFLRRCIFDISGPVFEIISKLFSGGLYAVAIRAQGIAIFQGLKLAIGVDL